jgi:hypothetical protein
MWPVTLSGRLLIFALVGLYLTNWLIRRGSILYHRSFSHREMSLCALMRYYQPFPAAIPRYRAGYPRVTHPSATQSTARHPEGIVNSSFVRLACVRHAASVHPEPGSNSHIKCLISSYTRELNLNSHRWIRIKLTLFLSVYCFLVCVLNLKI